MADLPRFVTTYKNPRGNTVYRFTPPQDIVDNKIAPRITLGTRKAAAFKEAARLNKLIDQYRSGEIAGALPSANSTVRQVAAAYYSSQKYVLLSADSQMRYELAISNFCNHEVEGKTLGDVKIKDITIRMCNIVYQRWADSGITSANSRRRILSILFNYAISLEAIQRNPMKHIDKVTKKARKVMWTKEQVRAFLNTAYGDYRYRSIGLIFHMAYEWCQRPIDIRLLTWKQIDLDNKQVTITQTKRGAEVFLPISDALCEMLKQQKEEFGFQPYVVPHHRSSDNAWRPYDRKQFSDMIAEVRTKAGLPDELKAWDLRRTGITEMIIAGVELTQIMQVSGHTSVASVSPYMVNTLEGATNALQQRFKENS